MQHIYRIFDKEGNELKYELTNAQFKVVTKTPLLDVALSNKQMDKIILLNDEDANKVLNSSTDYAKFEKSLNVQVGE